MSAKHVKPSAWRIIAIVLLLAIAALWIIIGDSHQSDKMSDSPAPTTEQPDESDDMLSALTSTTITNRHGELETVAMPSGIESEIIRYPGFTVSFNPKFKQPNYVAWELTGREVRTNVIGKRYDNFQEDPKVKGCPTLNDYRGSGYDRGHMAPAGDMKWDMGATEACFRLTNMSPQHHDLNSGTWLAVEEKCRDWAIRDSAIVVICGPILTDKIKRYIGRSHVAVPERYFKVILSPYSDPPMGIGFIMSNNKHNGGMQSTSVSIDEVERVTGFDFFAPLPDAVEDVIESECNFARWNHR